MFFGPSHNGWRYETSELNYERLQKVVARTVVNEVFGIRRYL